MYNQPFHSIDKSDFLEKYWQKAPCLFKNAFAKPPNYLSADELAGFSLDDEIESRLIIQTSNDQSFEPNTIKKWNIEHGPFEESRFSQLTESHWTLLIQSIDTWEPKTQQLLAYFNFLPRWRFDDIMISFAVDQGGVGPHADNYDVFLIQGEGQRHWRVGAKGDTKLTKSMLETLTHIDQFEPIIDVVMQPGDMLYIPPDTAHWGVSKGESIGYSIGYRTTQTHQLLALLTEKLSEKPSYEQFFTDDYRQQPNHCNQLEPQVVEWAQQELLKLANQPELLTELLAKHLSQSKLGIFNHENTFSINELTNESLIQLDKEINVNWNITKTGLKLNIEGESFDFKKEEQPIVVKLASYEAISIKLFNFSSNLVDFSPVMSNLIARGYIKLTR